MDGTADAAPNCDSTEQLSLASQLSQQLRSATEDAIRSCSRLPSTVDHSYWQSFSNVKELSDNLQQRLLKASSKLACFIDPAVSSSLERTGDEEECFRAIVESLDTAFERIDTSLDRIVKYGTLEQQQQAEVQERVALQMAGNTSSSPQRKRQKRAALAVHGVAKPQLRFKTSVDNSSDTVFRPVLRHKPHALSPLPDYEAATPPTPAQAAATALCSPSLPPAMASHVKGLGVLTLAPNASGSATDAAALSQSWPHPYERELLELEFLPEQLRRCREQLFTSLGASECRWIDSVEDLTDLAVLLEKQSELAIDLEHHHYRSFLGFTCLMQISTRSDGDFLIDTLALRDELHVLNTSFACPTIVKVLHGADSDILWLQRDHGLYVVNMFDTGQAARVLELPRFSLQYLLEHYCDVKLDKAFQLADWRVRPLSGEMLRYARMDTHYLLYLYDRLRNQLVDASLASAEGDGTSRLRVVLERSRRLCLQRYEKPVVSATSHLELLNRHKLVFSQLQSVVLRSLYLWRDNLARSLDESPGYVLPALTMCKIALSMPADRASLFAACPSVPALLRTSVDQVLALVAQAKAMSRDELMRLQQEQDAAVAAAAAVKRDDAASHFCDNVVVVNPVAEASDSADDEEEEEEEAPNSMEPVSTEGLLASAASGRVEGDGVVSAFGPRHQTVSVRYSASSSLFTDSVAVVADTDDSSDDDDEEALRRRAAAIRSSFGDPYGLGTTPAAASVGASHTDKATASSSSVAADGFSVPRSLAEVHKLSSENRRRMKEQRNGGDNIVVDATASTNDILPVSSLRAKGDVTRTSSSTAEEGEAVDGIDAVQQPLRAKAGGTGNGRRKRGSAPSQQRQAAAEMKPFDYARAAAEAAERLAGSSSSVVASAPFTPFDPSAEQEQIDSAALRTQQLNRRQRKRRSKTSSLTCVSKS